MIYISHRGNVDGKSDMENNPAYIDFAIHIGYDVEVDVWSRKGEWFLGHDEPTHKIDLAWLEDRRSSLWCHAKNPDALKHLCGLNLHAFGHDKDKYICTSFGYVITHPNIKPVKSCVAMLPEQKGHDVTGCVAVCSDVVAAYEVRDCLCNTKK